MGCRLQGQGGITTGGTDGLSRLAQEPQKLQHHTEETEPASHQWKPDDQPREKRQAQPDEEHSQTELGKHIVHDQRVVQPLAGIRSSRWSGGHTVPDSAGTELWGFFGSLPALE